MKSRETLCLIAISLIRSLGHLNARKLIEVTGSAEAVFTEGPRALSKLRLRRGIMTQIRKKEVLDLAEKEIDFSRKHGIAILAESDDEYPRRLKFCQDAPLILYTKGRANFNKSKVIAVVGTRHSTMYGESICSRMIEDLKAQDVQIVSGLAVGIDSCAHQAAIQNKLETVAVLAHGLNRLYPHRNKRMASQIEERGALLSDFASSTSLLPGNFPARNRIIAGLSDATIVVESGIRGGSLITADIANSYNREVFAIPGKVGLRNSEGCHWLIKNNKAALIEGARDLLNYMNWEIVPKVNAQLQFDTFNNEEQAILDLLSMKDCLRVDDLTRETGLPPGKIAPLLLQLEFKKVIRSLPGKQYELTRV